MSFARKTGTEIKGNSAVPIHLNLGVNRDMHISIKKWVQFFFFSILILSF